MPYKQTAAARRLFPTLLAALLIGSCAHWVARESAGEEVEGRGGHTQNWRDKLPRPEWAAFERVLADERWFEIYRIDASVYAIYEPGQFEEVISFLIVGETRALLFDTGLGLAPMRPLVERLTDRPILIVNSHGHYDHIGGNHEFSEIAGVDVDFAKAAQAGAPNSIVKEFVSGEWLWKAPSDEFDPDAYVIEPFTVDETIADGDIIDLGGLQLEVLQTPGHTPDSICLLDRAGRRLFVGDVFYLAPLYAHFPESSVEEYRASMERLAELAAGVDTLFTSHNVPTADVSYLEKTRDAFAAIKDGAVSPTETDGALEYSFDGFSIIIPATSAE